MDDDHFSFTDVIILIFFIHAMNLILWSIPSNVMNMDIVRSWSTFLFPPMVVVFHPCCEFSFLICFSSKAAQILQYAESSYSQVPSRLVPYFEECSVGVIVNFEFILFESFIEH